MSESAVHCSAWPLLIPVLPQNHQKFPERRRIKIFVPKTEKAPPIANFSPENTCVAFPVRWFLIIIARLVHWSWFACSPLGISPQLYISGRFSETSHLHSLKYVSHKRQDWKFVVLMCVWKCSVLESLIRELVDFMLQGAFSRYWELDCKSILGFE